jgi:hypothetical protein
MKCPTVVSVTTFVIILIVLLGVALSTVGGVTVEQKK